MSGSRDATEFVSDRVNCARSIVSESTGGQRWWIHWPDREYDVQVARYWFGCAYVCVGAERFTFHRLSNSKWLELLGCYLWIHVTFASNYCPISMVFNLFQTSIIFFLYNIFFLSLIISRLNHRDLQPNIGLFWYFFTEMFEHFRTLFLYTFQLNTILYLIPLTIKLHKQPIFLATILFALTAIFRSYPCIGDIAFYMALFPLWKQSIIRKSIDDNKNQADKINSFACVCGVNQYVFFFFPPKNCSDGQLFRGVLLLFDNIGARTDRLVPMDLL